MYINKIDDIIDRILDDFYIKVISKEKQVDKIFAESNFVKYQRDMNDFLIKYIATLNTVEVQSLVKNQDNVKTIIEKKLIDVDRSYPDPQP